MKLLWLANMRGSSTGVHLRISAPGVWILSLLQQSYRCSQHQCQHRPPERTTSFVSAHAQDAIRAAGGLDALLGTLACPASSTRISASQLRGSAL